MITNYLKTALRNLRRQIGNTLINVAGLTLGITGSLILFLFIKDGSSFDNYHSKRDRIYRINSTRINRGAMVMIVTHKVCLQFCLRLLKMILLK